MIKIKKFVCTLLTELCLPSLDWDWIRWRRREEEGEGFLLDGEGSSQHNSAKEVAFGFLRKQGANVIVSPHNKMDAERFSEQRASILDRLFIWLSQQVPTVAT